MPRTKKRFIEEVHTAPPDPSSDEEDNLPVRTSAYPPSSFRGGKQLRPMGGGGKQMRMTPQSDEDNSDEDDSDEEEVDTQPQQTVAYNGRPSGGKQFRPAMGGGKQLRYLQPQQESEEEKSEAEEEEESEPEPEPVVYSGGGRGGGKSLSQMQRGMGKQLRRPQEEDEEEAEESESSSEEEEEEEEEEPFVPPVRRGGGKSLSTMQRGGGKQLRRPQEEEEEEDEEDSDSSDGEEEIKPNTTAANEDMDIDDSDDSDVAEEPPQPAEPTRATRGRPLAKKEVESEEDDMEESSSEEESSEDEFSEDEKELDFETLDEKQLIEDEADSKHLDSLPEVERESILAERFEKLKAAQEMKIALRENKRKEREKRRLAGGKKTKSSKGKKATKKPQKKPEPKKIAIEEDYDEDMPDTSKDAQIADEMALGRTAKNRDVSGVKAKKKAALDKLRKDRIDAKDKDDSDLDYGDDADDDSDSEDEEFKPWNAKKKKISRLAAMDEEEDSDHGERTQRAFVEADLEDFVRVAIPRRRLSRWCNEPYFEKAVMGFYVRLAIGRDQQTQKPCYRLCKIVGIQIGKQYQFPQTANNSGKPISTNKWLKLKFGEQAKTFKMLTISDSKPGQDDVRMCLNQMKTRRADAHNVLSKKEAKKMRKMQDQLVENYTYTVQDIQKSIDEKKTLSKKINNIGAEKTKAAIAVKAAETQLEDAKELVDELSKKHLEVDPNEEDAVKDELDDANNRVQELEEELLMKQAAKSKIADAEKVRRERMGSTKNQHWAKVNERAKTANKLADVDAYKTELAARHEGAESATKDLFARRKVKPKILWDHGQYNKDEKEAEKISKEKELAEKAAQEERDDLSKRRDDSRDRGNGHKKKLAEQINDLAIEEEALTAGLMEVSHKKVSAMRVRKGISIQEYLERKTAGTL